MDKIFIRIFNQAEANEAKTLIESLGYTFEEDQLSQYHNERPWLNAMKDGSCGFDESVLDNDSKEVTIQQLRDLAVLHRKNPNDGNYSLFISDSLGYLNLYKTSDDVFYVFSDRLKIWDKSRAVSNKTEGLIAKSITSFEPDLISGKEAYFAIGEGKNVQAKYFEENTPEIWSEWKDIDITRWDFKFLLNLKLSERFKFRLKPETLKLELDIPAPFQPKEGELYWFISPFHSTGYDHCKFSNHIADKLHTQYGAYRTEEEIKQVVLAWREGIKEQNNA
ncbi:hypothetical protein SLK20_01060 [Acinetobacter pittii]|uniref:hypothetical protein n=1 Tax=Acinetobacter pittii TaxID=48296 RepID=UPI002A071D0C|nr:hypothetical protein [Acinetobacter pittii]MDX8157788.1 hypothetical protein [Acinetobacter pittii]